MEINAEPLVREELNPDLLKGLVLCLWQRQEGVLPMRNGHFCRMAAPTRWLMYAGISRPNNPPSVSL